MHMKVSPIIWKLDLSCRTLSLISFSLALAMHHRKLRLYHGQLRSDAECEPFLWAIKCSQPNYVIV